MSKLKITGDDLLQVSQAVKGELSDRPTKEQIRVGEGLSKTENLLGVTLDVNVATAQDLATVLDYIDNPRYIPTITISNDA